MHDDYNGVVGYNAQDIAVIVLPTKVNISNVVLPACIDWDQIYTVRPGSIGKVNLLCTNSHTEISNLRVII